MSRRMDVDPAVPGTSHGSDNEGSSSLNQTSASASNFNNTVRLIPLSRLYSGRGRRRLGDSKIISSIHNLISPSGSPAHHGGVPDDDCIINLISSSDSDDEILLSNNNTETVPPTITDNEIKQNITLAGEEESDLVVVPEIVPSTVTIDDEIGQDITSNEEEKCKITVLAERLTTDLTPNIVPYQIRNITLQGKLISGINVEPFSDRKFMVPLENLVQTILFPYSFQSCLNILRNELQTKLYCGNSEQMELLLQKQLVKSLLPDDNLMIMFDDLTVILVKLKNLLRELHREEFKGYSSSDSDDVIFVDSVQTPNLQFEIDE